MAALLSVTTCLVQFRPATGGKFVHDYGTSSAPVLVAFAEKYFLPAEVLI